jgi:electron transport complex protein RnfE
MSTAYLQIVRDGLWDNNVVFSQMLALCPLVAVTSSATNGLGMGLATTTVMVTAALAVSALRRLLVAEIRIPVFVLLIATIVTTVDMAINAWLHELHKVLGLFIPLIVTNCAILGRAEAFSSRNAVGPSVVDGLMMGLGFTLALVVMGAVRELIGSGTLFADAALLLGEAFRVVELEIVPGYRDFLLMVLPPGGFLVLGFLLAAKRLLDARRTRPGAAREVATRAQPSLG